MVKILRILGVGTERGPYYVPAYLASTELPYVYPILFAVDTGMDVSLISPRDALGLGIDFSKLEQGVVAVGIGGQVKLNFLKDVILIFKTDSRNKPLYTLKLDKILIQGRAQTEYEKVLPSLLGLDVLRSFSLHFEKGFMYLERKQTKALSTHAALAKIDREKFAVRYNYVNYPDRFVRELCLYIDNTLRAFFQSPPGSEHEVQNELEKLLIARNYEYEKESPSFDFSGKKYKPDFVFESRKTVLEVKLCNSGQKSKKIVDEIGADIAAYMTRFKHLVFVIYDLGFIRNPTKFKGDIERICPNVVVLIVQG